MGTGLGVGQGVVVIRKIEIARGGNCLELKVGQLMPEMSPGGGAGIIKLIIRIIHLIHLENLFQTALIEGAVMRHKRQALNHRGDLLPYVRKHRRILSILLRQPVNLLAEPLEIFRLRVDQTVE